MKRNILVAVSISIAAFFLYIQIDDAFARDNVIKLKFNDWGPPGIGIGKLHSQAAKMIEERTNGRVMVHCYFSQSLLKYEETFRGVSSNITDISLFSPMPVHDVNRILGMSFTDLPGMLKSTVIFQRMLEQFPEFNQEFERNGVRWISIRSMPPAQLHLVKKPVKTPQDLKGMRIIGDPYLADSFKKVGAAVLQLGPPDWYSSLERGLARGQMVHYAGAYEFKTQELFKYHTHFGDGSAGATPIGFVVNVKKWNSLPPDIRKIIREVYDWVNEESLKHDVGIIREAMESAKKDGHVITELSPSEVRVWLDWARPSNEKLLEQIESKGWPAKKIYEGMQQMIREARQGE